MTAVAVDWTSAVCAQTDPELWHPAKGETNRPALRGCKACPLTGLDGPCLAEAMREPAPPGGVRAGLPSKVVHRLWAQANGGIPCPDCGAIVEDRGGMRLHRRRVHERGTR